MANGVEAKQQPGADAVGAEGAVGEAGPVLVFDVEGADAETVGEGEVQTRAGSVGEERAVCVAVGQGDLADAGEEFGVGLELAGAEDGDPDTAEVVGLGDVLRGVGVEEAGFAFEAEAPLWVDLGVEDPTADVVVAVVGLEPGETAAYGDIAAWTRGRGNSLCLELGCEQSVEEERGEEEQTLCKPHWVTTSVTVCAWVVPEPCPVPTTLKL